MSFFKRKARKGKPSNQARARSRARQGDFKDPLSDPLSGQGSIYDPLRKKGGRGWKGQGYREIVDLVKMMENPSLPVISRYRKSTLALKKIDAWLQKHAKDRSKRAKAVRAVRPKIQKFHDAVIADGSRGLRDYLEGRGKPTLGTLTALAHRKAALRSGGESLNEQRLARWSKAKKQGKTSAEADDDTNKILAAAKKDSDTVQGQLSKAIAKLEKEHLSTQIAKEGVTGGSSKRVLGSGQMGDTHLADFGGKEMVFKEDGEIPEVMRMAGDGDVNLSSARAVASSVVNDTLKSSVIGKTKFAEMDGKHGTVMPLARGVATRKVVSVDWTGHTDLQSKAAWANTKGDVFASNGNLDYSDPVLQRELIELQINDIISGQIDRHAGNYHVEKDKQGKVVGVNAFDNDGSFGTDMVVWNDDIHKKNSFGKEVFEHTVEFPPLMSRDQADRIIAIDIPSLSARLHELLPTESVQGALYRVIQLQDHVYELEQQGMIVDKYDADTYAKLRKAGAKKSYVCRDALAKEQMDALHRALGTKL